MNTEAIQTVFDFACPTAKGLMRVDEVADGLRFDRSTIYELITEGKLECHRNPNRPKSHMRITRRSYVAYLAETAQYEPDDFVTVLVKLVASLDETQRRALIARIS